MTMTKVEIDVPEEIVPYTVPEDKDAQMMRNAMLVYPYIKKWCYFSWEGSRNAGTS